MVMPSRRALAFTRSMSRKKKIGSISALTRENLAFYHELVKMIGQVVAAGE
jgi:hypothetical protein